MKTLQTSGALNECVGQCISTALKKTEIEHGRQRKWCVCVCVGGCIEDKGWSGRARIWKFNYNCAQAVIPLVGNGTAERGEGDGWRWMEGGTEEESTESWETNGLKRDIRVFPS